MYCVLFGYYEFRVLVPLVNVGASRSNVEEFDEIITIYYPEINTKERASFAIGHFRVAVTLNMKARLSAKLFI